MRERHYTQAQFNQILEILIRYKRSCPEKTVYLSETSLQEALAYFMKSGILNPDFFSDDSES